ncbi:hypothetical protein [Kitasatospora sp. NPDC059827]|uniref:hypothetical protein n=1 Tax=Kitasatospora sp. NPDC059827 TaxID=3346964 RepID=UPI00364F528E
MAGGQEIPAKEHKTVQLIDGYVADVTTVQGDYAAAEIHLGLSGTLLTLSAGSADYPEDTGHHNGHTFVLKADGTVTATKDPEHLERRSAGSQELIDGYTADIVKIVSTHDKTEMTKGYEAGIRIGLSGTLLTLKTTDAALSGAVGHHNGHTFTLSADGKVTVAKDPGGQKPDGDQKPGGQKPDGDHKPGSDQKPGGNQPAGDQKPGGQKPGGQSPSGQNAAGQAGGGQQQRKAALPTVPKGGVKAGAESADSDADSRAGMLAGGVGLAGAGAAGLALALRRRGQA